MWRSTSFVGSSLALASRRLLSSSLPSPSPSPLLVSYPSFSNLLLPSSSFLRRDFAAESESAFGDALALLNKKQKKHWTENDFNSLLKVVTTQEDLEQARDVFEEIRRHLREFSGKAFHGLIDLGIKISNTTIPLQIVTLPANARLYPPEKALIKLLRQLYKSGDLEAVEKLHTAVRNNKYDIGEQYYYEHIHWANRLDSLDRAKTYFDELTSLPNHQPGETNVVYEYMKILAKNKNWNEILEIGNKPQIQRATTLRMILVAALALGDKEKAKQILEKPETVAKRPLKKHYEFFNNPEVLPLLQQTLQELVEEKKVNYGDDPELILLRIQLQSSSLPNENATKSEEQP